MESPEEIKWIDLTLSEEDKAFIEWTAYLVEKTKSLYPGIEIGVGKNESIKV